MNDRAREDRDDAELGALLRAAGRREQPPAEMAAAVREAVRAEWRAGVAARERRRDWSRYAMAASVAAVAVGAWLLNPLRPATEAATLASLSRVNGTVEVRVGDSGAWARAAAQDPLVARQTLRTGAGSRAAIAWQGGADVRLDENTVATLDGDRIVLDHGAVFIATAEDAGGAAPRVDTPLGNVQHLGTRYEVRVAGDDLSVAVRQGLVQVERDGRTERGTAGERLHVAAGGHVLREPLPAWDAHWSWLGDVTPPLDIEGRTVADFLQWAERETGRNVVYTTPAARASAERIVLHGTIRGLAPDNALDAVLSTTRLKHASADDGTLRIEAR